MHVVARLLSLLSPRIAHAHAFMKRELVRKYKIWEWIRKYNKKHQRKILICLSHEIYIEINVNDYLQHSGISPITISATPTFPDFVVSLCSHKSPHVQGYVWSTWCKLDNMQLS